MSPLIQVAINFGLAWTAGALIGLERSYTGRPAGFRTHALVALAAAAAAILTLEPMFLSGLGPVSRLDPSRLSQGVMAGIGFIGAGVIFKEGPSVQGLTTAASIWACAASGFLFGVGFWQAGILVTGAILATLSLLRIVDDRAPWRIYSYAIFRFHADQVPDEADLRHLIGEHNVNLEAMSYRLVQGGEVFEYATSLVTGREEALGRLAERLRQAPGLIEFELTRVNK